MRALKTQYMNPTQSMCFAEQRILPMVAEKMKVPTEALIDYHAFENQDFFTHIWGFKNELCQSPQKEYTFCKRLIRRIRNEFPNHSINDVLDSFLPETKVLKYEMSEL